MISSEYRWFRGRHKVRVLHRTPKGIRVEALEATIVGNRTIQPGKRFTTFENQLHHEADVESCLNPWNGTCTSQDIAVTIHYRGNLLPICEKCWNAISDPNFEWDGSEPQEKTKEDTNDRN